MFWRYWNMKNESLTLDEVHVDGKEKRNSQILIERWRVCSGESGNLNHHLGRTARSFCLVLNINGSTWCRKRSLHCYTGEPPSISACRVWTISDRYETKMYASGAETQLPCSLRHVLPRPIYSLFFFPRVFRVGTSRRTHRRTDWPQRSLRGRDTSRRVVRL